MRISHALQKRASGYRATRQESLEGITFTLATGLMGGSLSISNDGIMTFYGEDDVETVTNGLNSIYKSLDLLLEDYDLTTEEGMQEASKYIADNYKTIMSLIYYMYNYNDENEEGEDTDNK